MIGANTSPLGVILFVMMEVAKIPFNHMIRAFMPFYVPLIILLILITFFPTISLWLPRLIEGLQASGPWSQSRWSRLSCAPTWCFAPMITWITLDPQPFIKRCREAGNKCMVMEPGKAFSLAQAIEGNQA